MSRNFCFTSFSDSEPKMSEDFSYLIFKREKCPKTEKLHWQGFVQYNRKVNRSMKRIAEDLGSKMIHVEKCKGSVEENLKYVKKLESAVGEPKEFGKVSSQGDRNDLSIVKECKTLKEVPMELYIKFHKGIKEYRLLHAEPRNWMTEVYILWGPAGTGKSMYCPRENAYWKNDSKWWDGYDGEEEIVLDDWSEKNFSREYMIRLCDRYPLKIETKGGTVEFRGKTIYITTNENPLLWYHGEKSWIRRITFIGEMKEFIPILQV